MLNKLAALAALVAISSTASSCGCNGKINPPANRPDVDSLIAKLRARNADARSFRAKSTMDYWVGGERVRGTVLVQGKRGASMRFNALNPGAENVAVDLACFGGEFKYLNYNDNCKLVGACNRNSIAQLLRVGLEPDDFLLLAMGSAPVLAGDAKQGWDYDKGLEVITISAPSGEQEIIKIDMKKDRPMTVVYAELKGIDGKTDWKLTNKDFQNVTTEDGISWRLPGKSRFEQPKSDADLIVDWKDRTMNLELEDPLFNFDLDMGIKDCP
jgi:hypothetical protein